MESGLPFPPVVWHGAENARRVRPSTSQSSLSGESIMKSLSRPRLFVFVLTVLFTPSTFVMAQDVASLTGVVTDSSGAVVSDAAVKVLDTKTNASYEAKTNSLGAYLITRLQPGPGYLITVSKERFETVKIADVYLA